MEKTRFNYQHVNKPTSESESIDWLRGLTVESPMPIDVMWRIAQAIRYIDMRLIAHERALLAAAGYKEEAKPS